MIAKMRSPQTAFDDIPGKLPVAEVPEDADLPAIAAAIISRLETLSEHDLTTDAIWRDYLSLTGSLRTLYSSKSIATALRELREIRPPRDFKLTPDSWRVSRFGPETAWIDVGFTFTTHGDLKGSAAGIVSVVPDTKNAGEWKIWMLRTWLEHFDGHGDPDYLAPVEKLSNGSSNGVNGPSNGHSNGSTNTATYGAIIVGGGQAGLACAGRLKALGVPYLVVERNSQVGDNWAKRYESLRWHTSKHSGNLPFDRTFLPDEDYMLPAKSIGAGHKRWAERFDINIRLSTSVENASWDEQKHIWTVTISSADREETVSSRNLILCVGGGTGYPIYPDWPGIEKFKGTAVHGVNYHSSHQWSGKRGVVVGTANTGHDVAEDMVLANFESVTMVQRGKTFVFPAEWLHKAEDIMYHENLPTATADRLAFTYPNKIMREFTNRSVFNLIDGSPERFDALEKAGFKLDRKGDIYNNLYARFGGHYVDIGASARIVKGQIKMKSDSLVKEWTENGLLFEDGSELEADVIVLATGFNHDFREAAAQIVGKEIADAHDDYFGMDPEGEIRGAFKLAGPKGLYYHGGDVRIARFFSRFIALQVQADVLGKPLQPYLDTP